MLERKHSENSLKWGVIIEWDTEVKKTIEV